MNKFKVGDAVMVIKHISTLNHLILRSMTMVNYNKDIKNRSFTIKRIEKSRSATHYLIESGPFCGHIPEDYLEFTDVYLSPLYQAIHED